MNIKDKNNVKQQNHKHTLKVH